VANLNAATLKLVSADLQRVSTRLIVSGFREDEISRVKQSLPLGAIDEFTMDDWACLVISG